MKVFGYLLLVFPFILFVAYTFKEIGIKEAIKFWMIVIGSIGYLFVASCLICK
jgi:hypothetical protein